MTGAVFGERALRDDLGSVDTFGVDIGDLETLGEAALAEKLALDVFLSLRCTRTDWSPVALEIFSSMITTCSLLFP